MWRNAHPVKPVVPPGFPQAFLRLLRLGRRRKPSACWMYTTSDLPDPSSPGAWAICKKLQARGKICLECSRKQGYDGEYIEEYEYIVVPVGAHRPYAR